MNKYSVAVCPCDGINKQTHPLAVEAMKKSVELVGGFDLDFTYYDVGVEYAVNTGKPYEDGFVEALKASDMIFAGSCGHYDVEMSKTEYPGFKIGFVPSIFRKGMGNDIGLRPLQLMRGVESRLKNVDKIDIMLFRQLTEGGYAFPGYEVSDYASYDVRVVTRPVTEKLAHTAFKMARSRNGRLEDGKKVVNLGNKHSCFATLDFYRQIFAEVHEQYPDVDLVFTQIDALAEQIVKDPHRFDVVVCENEHGDIIGDIGALLAGGMGVVPTADVGGVTPHFRPNHGSFPRAYKKDFANPLAALITAGLMLDTVGADKEDASMRKAGALISSAVEYSLMNGGPRTKDMGGTANTEETVQGVIDAMSQVNV